MKKTFLVGLVLGLMLLALPIVAEARPRVILRINIGAGPACPPGHYVHRGYCYPIQAVVPACPAGYYYHRGYCYQAPVVVPPIVVPPAAVPAPMPPTSR